MASSAKLIAVMLAKRHVGMPMMDRAARERELDFSQPLRYDSGFDRWRVGVTVRRRRSRGSRRVLLTL